MAKPVSPRFGVLVLSCLVLAVAMSGCFASGSNDKVLKEHDSDKPATQAERIRFHVLDTYDVVQIVVATELPKDDYELGACDFDYQAQQWDCNDDPEPTGTIRVEIRYPDDSLYDDASLGYNDKATFRLDNPREGTWSVALFYRDEYAGPTSVDVVAPDEGGGPILGGSFWDILGVLIALIIAIGGFILYRRRTSFLSNEIHRIDQTYHTLSNDVDECRTNLLDLREALHGLLLRRKLQEGQYLILERRIEQYLKDLETPGNRHRAIDVPKAQPAKRLESGADNWQVVRSPPRLDDTEEWVDLE